MDITTIMVHKNFIKILKFCKLVGYRLFIIKPVSLPQMLKSTALASSKHVIGKKNIFLLKRIKTL